MTITVSVKRSIFYIHQVFDQCCNSVTISDKKYTLQAFDQCYNGMTISISDKKYTLYTSGV